MLKVKNNAKFMLVFGIMLVAMFIFNTNTVNAVEPTQEMLDLIPNEITLDIPETEYEKADKLIEQKIKEIWQSNSISAEGIKIDLYVTLLDIHTTNIYITNTEGNSNTKNKKVSLVYNNTNQKNSTDEQYVKNINIEKIPSYFEVPLNYINSTDSIWDWLTNYITQYYKNKINNSDVVIKAVIAAGDRPGLNVETGEHGVDVGIFKNGILYKVQTVGNTVTIPIINIPNTVSNNELDSYVSNLIENTYKIFKVKRITKGATNNELFDNIYANVPNIYTVAVQEKNIEMEEIPCLVIIRNNNTTTNNTDNKNDTKPVAVTDNKTNIKLETNDGVVPSNTVLEVQPITEGKIFDNVKKVLSNANKFKVFDITLKSNGVEIQPNGKVKISIPIPQDFDTSKLMVYRVEENGQKIAYKVNVVTIDNIKYAQFETDHFSTYVLAETDPNSNEKDNTPKTGIETNTIPYVLGIVATIGIAFIIKRK